MSTGNSFRNTALSWEYDVAVVSIDEATTPKEFEEAIIAATGAPLGSMAVYFCLTSGQTAVTATNLRTQSGLLLPNIDKNGDNIRDYYYNYKYVRFFSSGTASDSPGLNFMISGRNIPNFQFTGVNVVSNAYKLTSLTSSGGETVAPNKNVFFSLVQSDYETDAQVPASAVSFFNTNRFKIFKSVQLVLSFSYDSRSTSVTAGGGGGGVNRYVDLTDVSVPVPQDGLLTHYNATTAKFEQVPELKVTPANRNVNFVTSGVFDVVATGEVSLQSTGGGVDIDANGDMTLDTVGDTNPINLTTAGTLSSISLLTGGALANVVLQSNQGSIILNSSGVLTINPTTNDLIFQLAPSQAGQQLRITGPTPSFYASQAALDTNCIPNVQYVNSQISAVTLASLSDTTITTPSNGQVLTYQGGVWVNQATATGKNNFYELDDVNVTATPNPDEGIHYDAVASKWVQTPEFKVIQSNRNVDFTTTGQFNANAIGNVNITTQGLMTLTGDALFIDLSTSVGGNPIALNPSNLSSILTISGITPNDYVSRIITTPQAIPNVAFVNNQINAITLASLSDTTITAPANGEVLTYQGGQWINSNGGISPIISIFPSTTFTASLVTDNTFVNAVGVSSSPSSVVFTHANGIITYPSGQPNIIVEITINVAMYGDVQDERLFFRGAINGIPIISNPSGNGVCYSKNTISFAEFDSTRTYIAQLSAGDQISVQVARTTASTVSTVTLERALITVKKISNV